MMELPIPQDWDGETWDCFEVQWPHSDQWLGFFQGIMTLFARGRLYDARTGSIIAAQLIGREIARRNVSPVPCRDSELPPGGETTEDFTGRVCSAVATWDFGEFDMPCLDMTDYIRLNNGILEVKNECCEWVALGSIAAAAEDDPGSENPLYDPDADPPQAFDGCGKASGVLTYLFAIANQVWDHADLQDVLSAEAAIRGAFPMFSFGSVDLYGAILNAFNMQFVGVDGSDLLSNNIRQRMICELAPLMRDDHQWSDEDAANLKSVYDGVLNDTSYWGFLPGGATNRRLFFDQLVRMWGPQDIKKTAYSSALNTIADCSCPEGLVGIPDTDWYHSYDFTVNEQTFVDPGATAEYIAGDGWRSAEYGGYDINLRTNGGAKQNTTGVPQTSIITWIRMTYSCDTWVSGAKTNSFRADGITPVFTMEMAPNDGDHLLGLWTGYQTIVTDNNETGSIRIEIIRDECGAGAYYATCHKLEVAGFGWDPYTQP